MDIGNAIKSLRQKKKISQKDLANLSKISVNALCQIENNASFPQKGTIAKICDVLEVPTSYLLLFSITNEDVPEDKKDVFDSISTALKNILVDSK